jgi:hypothetical protein
MHEMTDTYLEWILTDTDMQEIKLACHDMMALNTGMLLQT